VNKHIQELVELSKTDKDIDSYQPLIDAADRKIKKAQDKLNDAHNGLNALEKLIADNEQKVASYEEQLKMLTAQLADNVKKTKSITTEKEMKALAVEEDIAKEKMTFANEEIERLQLINTRKSEELEEAKSALVALEESSASINESASETKNQINTSKVELFNIREKTIRDIDQKVLSFYEKIRIWAGNTAVVPVRKQACYGCYMKINDKTYADVIKGEEITTCPHCGRILHIEREAFEA
jgi:hypothetical protein